MLRAAAPRAASGTSDGRGEPADPPGPGVFETAPKLARTYRDLFRSILRRFRRASRGTRRGRRRRSVENPYAGRNIRLVPYRAAENLLAPLPTMLEAVRSGRVQPSRRLHLRRSDLLGWGKTERESLTLILCVDVSRSTVRYVRIFADILQSLAGHFQRNRDRMGLVSLQGRQATVLHHPTHNYRIVTRHLARLNFRGETPLADGLRKSLTVARLERFKNPGSQSLVVLLSDCCPEPLTPGHADIFDEPNYRDSRSAAALYRKEKVQLLVLFAAPDRPPYPLSSRGRTPGERLGEALCQAARGRLVRLPYNESGGVSRAQLDSVLGAIESMFETAQRGGADRTATSASQLTPQVEGRSRSTPVEALIRAYPLLACCSLCQNGR